MYLTRLSVGRSSDAHRLSLQNAISVLLSGYVFILRCLVCVTARSAASETMTRFQFMSCTNRWCVMFGQRAPLRRESRCIDSGSHCRHPPAGIDMDSCGNAQCPHKDKRGGDNQTSPCHRKVASYAQSAASQYQVIEHFLRLSY